MVNTVLNPTIIAKAAVRILDNELVMANRVYRGYEDEFDKKVNGYDIGDTVTIRKPAQFTVRNVITATIQDVTEGKQTFVVNRIAGVDFRFSSTDLTLRISELSERVIRPAMVQIANQIDIDLMSLYTGIPNWVGQPATGADSPVSSFAEFAAGVERMDEMSVPQDNRSAVLGPSSFWAVAGSQTALFMQAIGNQAYRKGEIGEIGGVATYMSQNVPTYLGTVANDDAATVTGAQSTTYAAVKDTESVPGSMSLITGGWGATDLIRAGTVFTIGTGATAVKAVNPVTKAVLAFQQLFTVLADVTAVAGAATLSISPAIIPVSGTPNTVAFATTSRDAGAGATIQVVGDGAVADTPYKQNLMFHKNAFGLVMVPMVKPPGAVSVTRESYKGISVRLIPYYDGVNDNSSWRLDVLYGIKLIDPRLAIRLSGGASTLGNPSQ